MLEPTRRKPSQRGGVQRFVWVGAGFRDWFSVGSRLPLDVGSVGVLV